MSTIDIEVTGFLPVVSVRKSPSSVFVDIKGGGDTVVSLDGNHARAVGKAIAEHDAFKSPSTAEQALRSLNEAVYAAIRACRNTEEHPLIDRAALRDMATVTDKMVDSL